MGESKRKKANGSKVLIDGEADLAQQGRLPNNPDGLRAADIDDLRLAALDHCGWLNEYSQVLLMPSPKPMTPQRLGTATRLQWAARYIRLLQVGLRTKENELEQLRPKTTDSNGPQSDEQHPDGPLNSDGTKTEDC